MWHKIVVFLFVSHTALLKQVFQVILWQTVLCNIPLNVCQMRVFSTSLFSWSQCTLSVKSLFQLSVPLRLINIFQEYLSISHFLENVKIFCSGLLIFHLSNHPAGALFPNFTLARCFCQRCKQLPLAEIWARSWGTFTCSSWQNRKTYFLRKDGSPQVCLPDLVMTPLDTAVCA